MRCVIARLFAGVMALGSMGVLGGCGGDPSSPKGGGETDPEPPPIDDSNLPDPICNAGTRWADGAVAFAEATASWGLDPIGADGIRLAAVDFDGDGWTDLVVRKNGSLADDYAPGGTRQVWLLRNNGQHGFED